MALFSLYLGNSFKIMRLIEASIEAWARWRAGSCFEAFMSWFFERGGYSSTGEGLCLGRFFFLSDTFSDRPNESSIIRL